MNILVCIKQVPDTEKILIDEKTNTLIRDCAESIVNPFDLYALEAAVEIKERIKNVKIIVISMGVKSAEESLRECIALGADTAYLINDKRFAGSDTFATSYILSEAIKEIEKKEGKTDAFFCGRQAIDGDTAQVGPEIAEHLSIPQITNVLSAEYVSKDSGIYLKVSQEKLCGIQIVEIKCPCLVTFTKSCKKLRTASLKSKLLSKKKNINIMTKSDIPQIKDEFIGLSGSPTRVKRTFVNVKDKKNVLINEDDPKKAADKLIAMLREQKGINL